MLCTNTKTGSTTFGATTNCESMCPSGLSCYPWHGATKAVLGSKAVNRYWTLCQNGGHFVFLSCQPNYGPSFLVRAVKSVVCFSVSAPVHEGDSSPLRPVGRTRSIKFISLFATARVCLAHKMTVVVLGETAVNIALTQSNCLMKFYTRYNNQENNTIP